MELQIDDGTKTKSEQLTFYYPSEPKKIKVLKDPYLLIINNQLYWQIPLLLVCELDLPIINQKTAISFTVNNKFISNHNHEFKAPLTFQDGFFLLNIPAYQQKDQDTTLVLQEGNFSKNILLPAITKENRIIYTGAGSISLFLSPRLHIAWQGAGFFHFSGDYELITRFDSHKNKEAISTLPGQRKDLYLTGDTSETIDLTNSDHPLFFLIQKHDNYLQFGNFEPDIQQTLFNSYNEPALGLDFQLGVFQGFIVANNQNQIIEKIQPQGTADFYQLSHFPIIKSSEKIWLIKKELTDTKDYKIVESILLQRGINYILDYNSGRLRFLTPLNIIDNDFNLQSIRITYDLIQDDTLSLNYGLRATLIDENNLKLNTSYTAGNNIINDKSAILSLDGLLLFDNKTSFDFELARDFAAESWAFKGELTLNPRPDLELKLSSINIGNDFWTPGALNPLPKGHELQLLANYQLTDLWNITFRTNQMISRDLTKTITDQITIKGPLDNYVQAKFSLIKKGNVPILLTKGDEIKLLYDLTFTPHEKMYLSLKQEIPVLAESLNVDTSIQLSYQWNKILTTSLYYQDLGTTSNRWRLSLEAYPYQGVKLYGDYMPKINESGQTSSVFGLQHSSFLTPQLRLSLGLEGKLIHQEQLVQSNFSGSGSLRYSIVEDPYHLYSTFLYEILYDNQRWQSKNQLSLQKDSGSQSTTFSLNYAWFNYEAYSQEKKDLMKEFSVAFTKRSSNQSPFTIAGSYHHQAFINPTDPFTTEYLTKNDLIFIDVGYQLGPTAFLYLQGGLKNKGEFYSFTDETKTHSNYAIYFTQGGFSYNITDQWALDFNLKGITDSFQNTSLGFGAELIYYFNYDWGLAAGYNSIGLTEIDFINENNWMQGPYLRLRFKF